MTSNNKLISTFEKISVFVVAALAFLMPTFFLTTTTEFFEMNKLALLTVATLIILGLFVAKIVVGGGFQVHKTTVDLALSIFAIIMVLSTLFSIDKTSSIWGAQGRWYPSLYGLIVFLFFYYIAGPNFKSVGDAKIAIYSFLGGSTVSSIVAILSYFKIYLGDETYLRINEFTLTGSSTTAALLAVISAVVAFYLVYTETFIPTKTLLITATIVNFSFAALIGKPFIWILLIIGTALAVKSLKPITIGMERITTMVLLTGVLSIAMLTLVPSTKEIIVNKEYSSELTLPLKQSWVISTASIQDYPLLATGPSTFGLNFTRYKPLSINETTLWNVRFDKPTNEFLNIMATTGVLGLLAFIFFYAKALRFAAINYKSTDESGLTHILAIATLLALLSYVFTYATVLNTFVLFFFMTLLGAAYVNKLQTTRASISELQYMSFTSVTTTIGETSAITKEYANIIAVSPFVLAALFGIYMFGKNYLAEYFMRQSMVAATANEAIQAYDYQTRAININPRRSAYHSTYAQTNLAIANAMAANPNLSDQDKQTIQTLVSQSIRSTRVATEAMNSLNVTDWETRALIYRSLINVADNAHEWAITAYNTAIRLEPSNPALRIDLGGVYFVKGDFLSAANLFRQATTLKNDYANAHYNLAQAFLNLKDFESAKRELEITRGLVPVESQDFKLVEQQLAALAQQVPTVAGANTETNTQNKPSIEQLTGENNPATNQAPLTTPTTQNGAQNLDAGTLPNSGQGTIENSQTAPANR